MLHVATRSSSIIDRLCMYECEREAVVCEGERERERESVRESDIDKANDEQIV